MSQNVLKWNDASGKSMLEITKWMVVQAKVIKKQSFHIFRCQASISKDSAEPLQITFA